jgi:hypothetical protein
VTGLDRLGVRGERERRGGGRDHIVRREQKNP